MNIPKITNKQKQIPLLLYKYRYLTINQIQKLLNHKDPHRIKVWLKILKEKKYIAIIESKDVTKPFICCLDSASKLILKDIDMCDENILKRLYKERSKTETFINHHLFLASTHLFFLEKKDKESELKFFTQQELTSFEHFPDPLPSAYLAVKTGKETSRYFLDLFDPYVPAFVLRTRVKYYLKYFRDGVWQAKTDNSPFPGIFLVCPNENLKRHIYMYGKSLIQKSFDNINLFLTTADTIKLGTTKRQIWEKVE